MAKLVFVGKEFGGRIYELQLEHTTVGRADDNTLVIAHKSVSHNHCEILNHGNEVIVRDLGSTNGTFVDDARLKPQAGVRSGQIIRFGDVEARLELESPEDHSSEVTAVYAHSRAVRDARRQQAKTMADPKATLKQDQPDPEHETQTLLMPAPKRPQPPVDTSNSATPPQPSEPSVRRWLVLGLILAAAAIIAWIVLR